MLSFPSSWSFIMAIAVKLLVMDAIRKRDWGVAFTFDFVFRRPVAPDSISLPSSTMP
jgi:hypothetical protein